MSSSYKLKSHPTQSLYDHITGVRDIALKTHKYHTIKPEIDDFIEIVCMCHDFGKGTTYFQRYLENDFRGIEKDHGPISAMFTYWMLPDKWKHLGFLIVKKHHGDINNASDECRIDEVSWDFKNQIKDILDNTIDELNQIYDKYLEGKNIEAFLNWLDDESNLKSIKKEHIIIFSTHIMELAVDLCDEIVILNKGQLSLINKEDLDDDAFQEKIIKILKDEDHA